MMSIYTYVVDHGDKNPAIGVDTEVNGGKVQAVMFDDGLKKLEEIEDFLTELLHDTLHADVKDAIRDFMS